MNVTELSCPAFRGHAVRIIHGFDIPITFLMTGYEPLIVQLKYLGRQHTHYKNIKPEHFAVSETELNNTESRRVQPSTKLCNHT